MASVGYAMVAFRVSGGSLLEIGKCLGWNLNRMSLSKKNGAGWVIPAGAAAGRVKELVS